MYAERNNVKFSITGPRTFSCHKRKGCNYLEARVVSKFCADDLQVLAGVGYRMASQLDDGTLNPCAEEERMQNYHRNAVVGTACVSIVDLDNNAALISRVVVTGGSKSHGRPHMSLRARE